MMDKINPKRLRIKMYSFLKAFLVLMKLLSLSQFYAPKFFEVDFKLCLLVSGNKMNAMNRNFAWFASPTLQLD